MELLAVFEKMLVLLIMAMVGVVAQKIWKTGPDFNKHLSKVALDVLAPCMILSSAINTTVDMTFTEMLTFLVVSAVAIFGLMHVIAILGVKLLRLHGDDKAVSKFALNFGNAGFFGYAIASILYGVDGLFYASIFNLAHALAPYTLGVVILTGGTDIKLKVKDFLSTPVIACIIGLTIFFLDIKLPTVTVNAISDLGDAAVPLSMIILGISIANMNFKEAFGDWRAYAVSAIRLIAVPIVVWTVCHFFLSNRDQIGALTILCSMPAAVMTVSMSVQYGRDEKIGAKITLISTLMSAITLPILYYILGML